MSRLGSFSNNYLIGFEEIERIVDRISKSANDAYPPLNIEDLDGQNLRITIAVAGFSPEHLSVAVQDRELVVKGERPTPQTDRVYLHKGIAARGFHRSFILADGLEVLSAGLSNGLLRIDLRKRPETGNLRQIPITIE